MQASARSAPPRVEFSVPCAGSPTRPTAIAPSSSWPTRSWPQSHSRSRSSCVSSTRARSPSATSTCSSASVAFVAIGKAIIFTLLGLHDKWWRYFLTRDFPALLRATALASAALVVVFTVLSPFDDNLPRSVVVFDFILTTGLLAGARIVTRLWIERPSKEQRARKTRGSLIIGAGSGGQMVVRELQLNPALGVRAIGFVDDDPRKRGMGLLGLRVLGTTDEIEDVLERQKPDEVVIAIPSAPGELRAKVVARLPRAAASRCGPCRPCSSFCAAASSSPASFARSRSRTCWAATPW